MPPFAKKKTTRKGKTLVVPDKKTVLTGLFRKPFPPGMDMWQEATRLVQSLMDFANRTEAEKHPHCAALVTELCKLVILRGNICPAGAAALRHTAEAFVGDCLRLDPPDLSAVTWTIDDCIAGFFAAVPRARFCSAEQIAFVTRLALDGLDKTWIVGEDIEDYVDTHEPPPANVVELRAVVDKVTSYAFAPHRVTRHRIDMLNADFLTANDVMALPDNEIAALSLEMGRVTLGAKLWPNETAAVTKDPDSQRKHFFQRTYRFVHVP